MPEPEASHSTTNAGLKVGSCSTGAVVRVSYRAQNAEATLGDQLKLVLRRSQCQGFSDGVVVFDEPPVVAHESKEPADCTHRLQARPVQHSLRFGRVLSDTVC
jgi:hypothetical protein